MRWSRPGWLLLWQGVAAWLLLALSPPAWAGDKAEARRLYEEGEAAYAAGRFLEAADRFERAHAELPRERLLWNIGQAYRHQYDVDHELGTLRHARSVFADYVELASAKDDQRDGKQALAEADQVIAERERADADAAAKAAAGSVAPPKSADPSTSKKRLLPVVALIGGGVVVAGVGLAFGLLAHGEGQTVQSASTVQSPLVFASEAQHQSRGALYDDVSFALYGVGGAAVIAGTVLAILKQPAAEKRAWVLPALNGVVAGGTF